MPAVPIKNSRLMRLGRRQIGRMGFWIPPTGENHAILKVEAKNLSNIGEIWVTSPMTREARGVES